MQLSKISTETDPNNAAILGWDADIHSAQDYYTYGMTVPGRNYTAPNKEGYRYGFNGMEKDDDWSGKSNSYDFGARIYDSRLGRFLSIDKFSRIYPSVSGYQFSFNNPIKNIDINGDSVWTVSSEPNQTMVNGRSIITIEHTINIELKVLNVSDDNCDLDALSDKVKTRLSDALNQTHIVNNTNSTVIHKFKVGQLTVEAVQSAEKVSKTDHLSVLIDEALPTKNKDGTTRSAGGWGRMNGQINYIQSSSDLDKLAVSIVHELGHNMGLDHLTDEKDNVITESGNYMSYGSNRTFFSGDQLLTIVLNDNLNQGHPTQKAPYTTNNRLYNNATNEEPWDFNVNKGDIIPTIIKPPKTTNDIHNP